MSARRPRLTLQAFLDQRAREREQQKRDNAAAMRRVAAAAVVVRMVLP